MKLLVVLCTFPNIEIARQIGTSLVESQLAACVNLIQGVESIYRWGGEIQRDAEVLGLIKTTRDALAALEARIKQEHPYDTPEIVALAPEAVEERYARWIGGAVGGNS